MLRWLASIQYQVILHRAIGPPLLCTPSPHQSLEDHQILYVQYRNIENSKKYRKALAVPEFLLEYWVVNLFATSLPVKNYHLTASEPTSCKSTRSTISGLAHKVAFINATSFWFAICAPSFPVPGFVSLGRSQICKLCHKQQAVEIMLRKMIFKSLKKGETPSSSP